MDVDVFIRRIDAAGISHLPVDHHDLLMVAVIEVKAGYKAMGRAEYRRLNTLCPQGFIIVVGNLEKAAHVVIQEAHLHPLVRFSPQYAVDPRPQLPLRHNEIFHQDKPLRLFQVGNQAVEIILP